MITTAWQRIQAEPEQRLDDSYLQDQIGQPCQDPVILVQDANPSPPPTHRHSQWWQDPRVTELGRYLVSLLSGSPRIERAAKPTQRTETGGGHDREGEDGEGEENESEET